MFSCQLTQAKQLMIMTGDMFSYRSWWAIESFLLVSMFSYSFWREIDVFLRFYRRESLQANHCNHKSKSSWYTFKFKTLKYQALELRYCLQTADGSSKTFFQRFSINTKCNLSKSPDDSFAKHWVSPFVFFDRFILCLFSSKGLKNWQEIREPIGTYRLCREKAVRFWLDDLDSQTFHALLCFAYLIRRRNDENNSVLAGVPRRSPILERLARSFPLRSRLFHPVSLHFGRLPRRLFWVFPAPVTLALSTLLDCHVHLVPYPHNTVIQLLAV